jgi:cell shape-determining protein MreC
MARKHAKLSRRMLFTWLMLAAFIFLFAPRSISDKFQFAFARVFRWPLSIGRNISLCVRTQQPPAGLVSRREYDRLRNHADNLAEALIEGRQRFEELYGLYNRYVWDGFEFVLADVITASTDRPHGELIINCGENNGLAEGQFVLGNNSIIGAVCDVSSYEARIRLITDSTSNIAVKIGEFRGVMKGDGGSLGRIESAKHRANVGDGVYAVRKPGFLDSAVKIGTVARCESSTEHPLLWDITVKPACDAEELSTVDVIVMNPKR